MTMEAEVVFIFNMQGKDLDIGQTHTLLFP